MSWNPFARPRSSSAAAPPSGQAPPMPAAEAPPAPAGPAGVPLPDGPIAEVERVGDIAIATLTVTELAYDGGAERLAELLLQIAETGALHFVLDVQNVQYMDSACVGCLVEALNRLAAHGGRIALVNPNHSVHYIFKLTRLDRVFTIASSVPNALHAIEQGLHEESDD